MHIRLPLAPSARRPAVIVLATLLLACGVATLDAGSPVTPASAAVTGAGISGITPYGGYLGNYIAPDGSRVYCIDANLDWPSGPTGAGVRVDSVATSWGDALDATTLRKLNYALLTWGQTEDPVLAAAVSAYLYAYTSGYARTHGAGYAAGAHYIGGNSSVAAAYDSVWNQAETQFAGTAPTAAVDVALDGRSGTVDVSVTPEDALATLTLSGATVAGTDATTVEVTDGSRIAVSATAPESATTITVEAVLSVEATAGAAPELILYTTPGQQRTVRGGGPVVHTASARDTATAEVPDEPELARTGGDTNAAVPLSGAGLLTAGALTLAVRRRRSGVARSERE